MKKAYTLGTGRRSEEDFMEILFAYDIKTLVDVRIFPKSKMPVFTRENLENLLKKEGINYVFLGRELGGFRKGGYEAYTTTEEFRKGVDVLEDIASKGISVIICAERFPWKCHRRWISRELHRRGWQVEHILDKGKVWAPKG
ncbi:MAG: DUF488 domain-containing protein [Nitrospirae bacterium]|nr:DUF488 domain-containing protein [Nitrospirota bacterium]MBI3378476.1 DUF488 domain-containing protein [Nitrospirota bacterium]